MQWIPWLEKAALIEQLSRCHVNLGIFGATTKAAMVIPTKVFQAVAMGVPVITRESPAIHELLEHGRSVILCKTDGASLADAIATCKRDSNGLQLIGQNGRDAFTRRASHPVLARQFVEALHAG